MFRSLFGGLLRRLLPKSALRDIRSVEETAQVYNALRSARLPEADALAARLADAENLYVAAMFAEPFLSDGLRQSLLSARMAAEEWLRKMGEE
jgi:hypothetical protein